MIKNLFLCEQEVLGRKLNYHARIGTHLDGWPRADHILDLLTPSPATLAAPSQKLITVVRLTDGRFKAMIRGHSDLYLTRLES